MSRLKLVADVPFIMPAIRNGKTGGINQYLKGRKSYKTTHTMNEGKDNEVTFPLWVICLTFPVKSENNDRVGFSSSHLLSISLVK